MPHSHGSNSEMHRPIAEIESVIDSGALVQQDLVEVSRRVIVY